MEQNPFWFGGHLQAPQLVDRKTELKQVSQTLTRGGKLFLIGPRRFGKTSVLQAAITQVEAQGAVILHLNCEAFPSLQSLTERLFHEAGTRLVKPSKKAGQTLKRVFARLRPEISFSLTEQTISASLNATDEQAAAPVPLLVDVLNGIEALAQIVEYPVGIVLDEFQFIIEQGGVAAEGQLRAAMQTHQKTGYVLAGSKTRMLAEMTMDHARPFYRLGTRRFLDKVPTAEFVAWIQARLEVRGWSAATAIVEELLHTAEEVPYDVQRLAHYCYDLLDEQAHLDSGAMKLTSEIIAASRHMLIAESRVLYQYQWNQLTQNQKLTLMVVAQQQGVNLMSQKVIRGLRLTTANLQKALPALREKGVLWEEELPQRTRWRFEDPFFAHWIRDYLPTEQTLGRP